MAETRDTSPPPKYRWLWRIASFVWDPLTLLMIFLLALLVGVRGEDSACIAVFFLTVYLFFVVVPASEAVKSEIYPLYLAYKTVRADQWRSYWFQKFRYRVLRSAKRSFRFAGDGLFLQARSIEIAKELERPLKSD